MKQSALLLLMFFSVLAIAQEKSYPTDYFRSPLDIPLLLSGNFGELRSNHFHSGIDIKTQQREGLHVYAPAEGYVSRIKVSHFGYGKALYVTHPNGYTTVYGHLNHYSDKIEAYIKKLQYENESYEVEAFPSYTELPVEKGEVIAYSGNSGGSGGPHLHFEFRDTETENIINPILYGMEVEDDQAPVLQQLYGYAFGNESHIKGKTGRQQLNFTYKTANTFVADKIFASGIIGFGIKGYDRQKRTYNHNGIYKIDQKINGSENLNLDFETFAFAESSQINLQIDYEYYINHRSRIFKCFQDPGNTLSIYNASLNAGLLTVKEGQSYSVTINLSDIEGNTTTLIIPVEGKTQTIENPTEDIVTPYFIQANRDQLFELDENTIYFPATTFYQNQYIPITNSENTLTIGEYTTPVENYYSLSMPLDSSITNPSPYFIAWLTKNGTPIYQDTRLKDKILTARTKKLGQFKIMKDTIAPKVTYSNFKNNQWISNYSFLKFKISDDLSGIKSYRATIDGEYILTEYDYKTNTLQYNCKDKNFEGSKHILQLEVTDNVGNNTTFTRTFFRKY